LTPAGIDKFESKGVDSSDASIVSASVSSTAQEGTFSILVNQLAKNDAIFSDAIANDDTTVSTITGAGTFSFNLNINGVATPIEVSITAGETNSDVIKAVASAINSAGIGVKAQKVSINSTTSRLYFSSTTTGKDYAISFSDITGTLLSSLGLTDAVNTGRTTYTATSAGFQNTDSNLLDAKFTFNGVDIQRSSNTVTDLLQGVTFSLKKAQALTDTPVTINVSLDQDTVVKKVQDFINSYNDTISALSAKSNSGVLQNDSLVGAIISKLRSIVLSNIDSVTTVDGPDYLVSAGMQVTADGKLNITDKGKFTDLLNQNPHFIADLFVSTDESGFVFEATEGIAHQISSFISDITSQTGLLRSATDNVNFRIRDIDRKITKLNDKVESEVQKFKDKYAQAQKTLQLLSQQSQILSQFSSNILGNSSGS